MASINSYKISDIYWNPIDFNIIGKNFSLKNIPVVFDDGMSFNLFNCFENLKDFSINNNNFIVLTDLYNNTSVLEDVENPSDSSTLSFIESPMASYTGNIFTVQNFVLKNSRSTTFKTQDKLIFTFEDSKVSIKTTNDYYLTDLQGIGLNQLVFKPRIFPFSNTQYFDYILGENCISLFRSNDSYSIIITENTNGTLEFKNLITTSSSVLPNNSIFLLPSFDSKDRTYNTVSDSSIVTYDANPLVNKSDLSIKTKNTQYNQNYLGIFPFKNYTIINDIAYYDIHFHGLKNYQTTEYNYNTNILNRVYNRIYTGSNQDKGNTNISLGYQTSSIKIEFKPDTNTKFYFSPTSQETPLNKAGFIESGATAGTYPYTSDRLVSYTNNLLKELSGSYIPSPSDPNTKFLCSWLSKDENNNIAWFDRYYNSAYYTTDQALSASKLVYHDKLIPDTSYVYDVPSSVKLFSGFLYEYHHTGKKEIKDSLKYLNYNYKDNSYSNILEVTDWSSSSLVDNSIYKNNGLVYNSTYLNFKSNYFIMDGNNYAIFPAKNVLLPTDKLTVSLWINTEDWSNINGYQIFGNYYDSGFGLINESNSFSPIFTVVNNSTKNIYNLNYRFSNLSKVSISSSNYNDSFNIIQRLPDYTYWIFNSTNLTAIKYSMDNFVIYTKNISGNIKRIDQVEIDGNENFYIYDNTLKTYVKLNSIGDKIGQGNVSSKTNRIEIDLNNNLLEVYGNASVIDNDNILWEIIGPNLYKTYPQDRTKRVIHASVGASDQITCDGYNNLWILTKDNNYVKINSSRAFEFSKVLSTIAPAVEPNCPPQPPIITPNKNYIKEDLPFLSTKNYRYIDADSGFNLNQDILVTEALFDIKNPKPINTNLKNINFINYPSQIYSSVCNLSSVQQDSVIIIDNSSAMIINQIGEELTNLNFGGLIDQGESIDFYTQGDFTGYQNIRKYKNISKNLSWKFKIAQDVYGKNPILLSLKYPSTNLSKGWHLFTFTFDSINGLAKYYIDSILVDSVNFNAGYVLYYAYKTSLLLGATTVKNAILNTFVDSDEGYRFIGSVSDLKMYNIALNHGDVETIYFSSEFSPEFKSINWNMEVGSRNYIEEIKHWFKFQLPGSKSKYYNIKIHNLNVNDEVKSTIESAIKNVLTKITPSYTSLYKIKWN